MKKLFLFLVAILLTATLFANNISISNLSLTGKNTGSDYILVQFDFSWENSWRTSSAPNNWDAAWVFVKYRVAGGAWQHAWLNETGHTAPTGSTITPGLLDPGAAFNASTNPGLGAFIYRSADGTGTFSKTGAQLQWNYGANGVADDEVIDVQVFAIEMVYVTAGAFTLGSGGTENGSFTNGSWTSGATVALSISSESALTIGQSAGNLWGISSSGNNTIGGTGTLAAAFPKGYNPFYCMKYEISQQQYVDFLNTLTQTQATARKHDKPSPNYRYEITGNTVGSYATTNPYVAGNYLSWMDGAAYTDWAGLRPMTELEFEKASRGTVSPVANEYAWGSTSITAASGITNSGLTNEIASNSGANAHSGNSGPSGPMRVGAFATASTTRAQGGSTYYGIMEMSGNLWERTVTVGHATGRAFTGVHGNGTLTTAGYADLSTWPGYVTSEVTGEAGSGYRGGSGGDDVRLYVSDRFSATEVGFSRSPNHGFRAVRAIPPTILAVGDLYKGGRVVYILKSGDPGYDVNMQKGLIAALVDQTTGIAWITGGSTQTTLNSNTLTAYGKGQDNTNFMIAQTGYTGGAAKICDDYTNTETGTGIYSDWYLPSKDELYQLSQNWNAVDGLSAGVFYWSSSEGSISTSAWFQQGIGGQSTNSKASTFYVRAVRSFPTLPTVTTSVTSYGGGTTASGGGEVTSEGDFPVTAKGVCWSITTCPTIADSPTNDGTGAGIFSSTLTDLNFNYYYVRAYATNSAGTAYGNQVPLNSCFIAGTKITLSDGTFKNIEAIVVGDKVKSVNPATMETVDRAVVRTLVNPPSNQLLKITFSNGTVNTNTKIHPYYVKGKGWSSVDPAPFKEKEGFSSVPLAVGDECQVLENGKLVTVSITSIEMLPDLVVPTYNFTVEGTNCYFANGILVHNK
jgi:formylglycine-generating enzyme required for sulfatase activity